MLSGNARRVRVRNIKNNRPRKVSPRLALAGFVQHLPHVDRATDYAINVVAVQHNGIARIAAQVPALGFNDIAVARLFLGRKNKRHRRRRINFRSRARLIADSVALPDAAIVGDKLRGGFFGVNRLRGFVAHFSPMAPISYAIRNAASRLNAGKLATPCRSWPRAAASARATPTERARLAAIFAAAVSA